MMEESFGIGRNNDTELPRNSKSLVVRARCRMPTTWAIC